MCDLQDLEAESWQVFNRVHDIREVVQRRDKCAIVNSYYSSVEEGHSSRSGGLEEDLRRWDDSWEYASP